MELIIIGFHIALVVSIILLIQAIREKKKLQALEAQKAQDSTSSASLTSTTSLNSSTASNSSTATAASSATSATTSEPVSEQQKAVQLVHDGLEHVVDHLSHLGSVPEMSLAEAKVKAGATDNGAAHATTDATGNGDGTNSSTAHKNCPNCNEPWDNAFDFCIKCSHK